MIMGDESARDSPVVPLAYPIVIRPILDKLERKDVAATQTLRAALNKAETVHPGLTCDLIMGVLRKAEISINMNESILRLESTVDMEDYRLNRTENAFQELNRRSANLGKILSRIPDEINDRKTFLETIKEIASAIKKLLDAVHEVSNYIPTQGGKQQLEQRKREFVKYSKRFSNTLKDFFREGQANAVFYSANCLIHQTNLIMLTVKEKCE